MVGINDSLRYTEDNESEGYIDNLPHTTHMPSLKERVKVLEEEVAVLRNQIGNIIQEGI